MARKQRTMGSGTVISVLLKMIHPSKHIRDKFPNLQDKQRLEDAVVLRKEIKSINRREQEAIIFRHDDFADKELYASQRFYRILEEGPTVDYFVHDEEIEVRAEANNNIGSEMTELYDAIAQFVTASAGVQRNFDTNKVKLIQQHVVVDDDNEPLPENVTPTAVSHDSIFENEWGHSGICPRRMATNNTNPDPQLNVAFSNMSKVELFEAFFMKDFIKKTLLVNINNNIDGKQVTYGEFLRWLGLWFLMSTVIGPSRRAFFSTKETNEFSDAPFRLHHYMSYKRFTAILDSINYRSKGPPTYKDRFWEIREMIEAWNASIIKTFSPGAVNCLDESMSPWTNGYT